MVKSALRVMEILEFLRQSDAATVGDICKALNYPNSSTSVLLKSLTDAGYLDYDSKTRKLRPSFRVSLLGEGIDQTPLLSEGVKHQLRQIHERTGETVLVGLKNGAYVQYGHVLAQSASLMRRLPVGKMRLMAYNPLGEVLLAQLDDKRVTSILRHNNANWHVDATRMTEAEQWSRIEQVRMQGYCIGPGRTWPDAIIIARAIRPMSDMPWMSVAVGGLSCSLEKKRDMILDELAAVGTGGN